MQFHFRALTFVAALSALAACGSGDDADVVRIALIGEPDAVFETGLRLSMPAQQVRAATVEGLVAIDETGAVVPALAERWIVTDDGMSYIFRLRNSDWPDGTTMTAEQVRDALKRTLRDLSGTSLGLDLAPISEVRAMTGRVIEIRLSSAMPDFLQLLAQPELGIFHKGKGTGPMELTQAGTAARLSLLPPETRGLPTSDDWREGTRVLALEAMPARQAVDAFSAGDVDIVLGGTIVDLPLAPTGPLSRGNIRLDAARGLLGLRVLRAEGLLAEPARREALALAIERETLLAPFNIAGWIPSTRIAPVAVVGEGAAERWTNASIEQRRADARRRIAGFEGPKTITVALPEGPGADLLLREIAADWREVGVNAVRARSGQPADLELVDTLARYGSRRWFLNQFACRVRRVLCDPKADELVQAANREADPAARATLLAEAETRLTAQQGYIPLGAPVRWSLVRGDISGFIENNWAIHPLYPLALAPR
ncbi:Periplasmic oligopeptide-binding protein precursor [Tsuneonella dongtanensis]|uniref:Periplasmic oligopeptide-binding protein n=1 Tax=Tsuneonella dongtanensis TaxID=692370 RepID=A0A1B2A9C3_9SPHN|nr:ABC transporter substrate-binding protein [Tsuneonella dongtanensis]ANY18767.1 Periplasmic oligopeptide-binding protein precursor [Tsuneonella dongtanensis]